MSGWIAADSLDRDMPARAGARRAVSPSTAREIA
jgi:hypothetical protein